MTAAYTPGAWSQQIPPSYVLPQPAQVPLLQPMSIDPPSPILARWPALNELVPIALPPIFDTEAERARLEDQAELLRELDRERDEFGDDFFDENEESRAVRESLEALGKDASSHTFDEGIDDIFRHRVLSR
jgi:hypothetical protein